MVVMRTPPESVLQHGNGWPSTDVSESVRMAGPAPISGDAPSEVVGVEVPHPFATSRTTAIEEIFAERMRSSRTAAERIGVAAARPVVAHSLTLPVFRSVSQPREKVSESLRNTLGVMCKGSADHPVAKLHAWSPNNAAFRSVLRTNEQASLAQTAGQAGGAQASRRKVSDLGSCGVTRPGSSAGVRTPVACRPDSVREGSVTRVCGERRKGAALWNTHALAAPIFEHAWFL